MDCSKNTCCWPIALPLPCMTETLLRIATWLCPAIKQVCVRRSASVSHSMARLPVWSPAWGSIGFTRLADLDGSCAFLTLLVSFLSSCFLFFVPVRTCTSSFSGLKGSGNVVIGRKDVLDLPLNITVVLHHQWISLFSGNQFSLLLLETRNSTNRPRRRLLLSCVVTGLFGLLGTPPVLFL